MPPLLKHNKTAFCHTVTKFSLDNILPRTLLCNGNGPMVQWIPYSWGALGSNIFPISISKTWSASWNRKSSALEFMPPLLTPYKPLFVVQSQNCSLDNILPRTFLCSGNGPMVQWIPYSWGALGSNIFPISMSKTWSASWNKKSSVFEFMPPLLTPYKTLFVVQSQDFSLDNILSIPFLCSGNGPMVQWIPYSWGALGSNIFPMSISKTWSASWNNKPESFQPSKASQTFQYFEK